MTDKQLTFEEMQDREVENLKSQLKTLRNQNFEDIAKHGMQEYQKKYGSLPDEKEHWRFLVGEYSATCEGSTTCILITQASPNCDDYSEDRTSPINSQEYRAVREFHERFGTWMLHGLQFLSRDDFYKTYAAHIPPALVNLKNQNCSLNYSSELHFNFS